MENKPIFLNFNECKEILKKEGRIGRNDGIGIFKKLDNTEVELSYKSLADPTYDQTFKTLFIGDTKINGINSEQRLMSILNSLLFLDTNENDLKIRKIKYLPNEKVDFNIDVLKVDVICECICWELGKGEVKEEDQTKFCVVFEMQIKYTSDFIYRFKNYKDSFKSFHRMPVVIISFLNYKDGFDPFYIFSKKFEGKKIRGIGSFIMDDENNPLALQSKFYNNVFFFHLKSEINDLNQNKVLKLNNKALNSTGMAWIKLLSLRHWASEDYSYDVKRYIIPGEMSDLPIEIQSAISILQFISNEDLKLFIESENEAFSRYGDIYKEGEKNGLKEGLKKGEKKMELIQP